MNVTKIKAAVRVRDGHRCTECGTTNEESIALTGNALDVHRLNPGSPYNVDGCVTLCRTCHGPKPKKPSVGWGGGRQLDNGDVLISLPGDLYRRLVRAAERNGRPTSWEARQRLKQSLDADEPPAPPAPNKDP